MLDKVSDYSLVYVLLKAKDASLPVGYLKKHEILSALEQGVKEALSDFNAHYFADTSEISLQIYQQMLSEGIFQIQSDPVVGDYFQILPEKYKKFRANFLEANEIYRRSKLVGSRFFPEVFERFSSAIADGSFEGESSQADVVSIPASDRIVTLSHNQVDEFDAAFDSLIEAVEKDNGNPDNPGLRERILGQIKAGRELILSGQFRAYLLYEVLIKALNELVEKYGNETIKSLANALLGAIVSQLFEGQ